MKTKLMTMCLVVAVLAIGSAAQASMLTITLNQVGNNVVGTAGGTVNTSVLTVHVINYSDYGMVIPQAGVAAVGPQQALWYWSGLAGGAPNFGLGAISRPDIGTGDMVGINMNQRNVYLPTTYVSGSELSGTSTWNNKNFESMSITPGTYTMTYNGGADSVVLQVNAVPEPATVAILGLGSLSMLFGRRRKA